MAIDESALRRLIEHGRRRGRVTTEDLHLALPIPTMDATEIAAVVERLEDAGLDVELDERFSVGRRPAAPKEPTGDASGAIAIGEYAGPAVAAPGVRPSHGGWIGSGDHASRHGTSHSPTWEVRGVDMIPLVCIVGVALVLTLALG